MLFGNMGSHGIRIPAAGHDAKVDLESPVCTIVIKLNIEGVTTDSAFEVITISAGQTNQFDGCTKWKKMFY